MLWRSESYEHSYPHCWRCHTPLIYYALPSWFIRTTEIRDRLVEENERTNWYPPHIKHGRYGGVAREQRRLGALAQPLLGHAAADLAQRRGPVGDGAASGRWRSWAAGRASDLSELDPHRPFVDDVTFPAPSGTGTMRRVTDVIDVWYDSGAMPFAQWGAPHHHEADFEQAYPAQYICEAIDQTRGWFYSLMAVGTLVFDRSSYENVVCLGLLLDEQGRKMSKHLGNVLDPFELFDSHGADAVRWLMLAQGSPWVDRRVGHEALREIVRKVLLTYWNTASFLVTYANASGWRPTGEPVRTAVDAPDGPLGARRARGLRPRGHARARRLRLLERRARDHVVRRRPVELVRPPLAPPLLARASPRRSPRCTTASRRSRGSWRRSPRSPPTTSGRCSRATWSRARPTRCTSPTGPRSTRPRSTAGWPTGWRSCAGSSSSAASTRAASGVRTRQPLARAVVAANGVRRPRGRACSPRSPRSSTSRASRPPAPTSSRSPSSRTSGRWASGSAKQTPVVAEAVKASTDTPVDGALTVVVDGEEITLSGDEILVEESPREGWAVRSEGGLSVGLDTELTDELRAAGLARDVVRVVQEARKTRGLEVSDRIALTWAAERADVADAVRTHAGTIAEEVLAVSMTEGTVERGRRGALRRPRARRRHHADGGLSPYRAGTWSGGPRGPLPQPEHRERGSAATGP